tara:strand:- start:128 stop:937 length:810 start_codon:yes stop_codon:yes gene_type:complete
MPRKSTKLRIQQGKDMLQRYEDAGIQNVWPAKKSYQFVGDMLLRLQAGRGWSKRQREWYDSCVDSPTPVIESADSELEARLRKAFEVLGRDGSICVEFAERLRSGKNLTEKQMAWAQKCLDLAEKVSSGNEWIPSEEEVKRMHLVVDLRSCYNDQYWYSHPGQRRSLEVVESYLKGDKAFITKEDIDRAEYAVRGKLKKIDNPRFVPGSRGWIHGRNGQIPRDLIWPSGEEKHFALICSNPYPSGGKICYDVLVNGEARTISGDSILKR